MEARDEVVEAFRRAGVWADVYYRTPVHRQPFYVPLHDGSELPGAEGAARRVLSIPVHPGLAEVDVERVVDVASMISRGASNEA